MSLGQSELTEFQTAINGQDHLQREREGARESVLEVLGNSHLAKTFL